MIKTRWIRSLRDAGRMPEMVLLDSVRAGRDMHAPERHWIRTLRAVGQADLNSSVPADCREKAGVV